MNELSVVALCKYRSGVVIVSHGKKKHHTHTETHTHKDTYKTRPSPLVNHLFLCNFLLCFRFFTLLIDGEREIKEPETTDDIDRAENNNRNNHRGLGTTVKLLLKPT